MTLAYNRRFSIAPMMDYTDRHERYFLRLITRHTLLYTEMVTSAAIVHGDRNRLLDFDAFEHPVALQLGGSDPGDLAMCAKIGEDWGYDEINLNVGCPSDRVQSGWFGACLMAEPDRVHDCVAAMRKAVSIPVTVKTRIGIDHQDSYEELVHFVNTVAESGCDAFIFHARKAWLQGLSPKENRDVPPLRYDVVYQIKRDFPHLHVSINGGIQSIDVACAHLQYVDGVMVGRAAYSNPYFLSQVDRQIFEDDHPVMTRKETLHAFLPYVQKQLDRGTRLYHMAKHIVGLFRGLPGARAWRRHVSENAYRPDTGTDVLVAAAEWVDESPIF